MMSVRRASGAILVLVSLASVVQTAREVSQGLGSGWAESPVVDTAFTFAGRTITILKPPRSDGGPPRAQVQQERVRIDGVDIGAVTELRMATWRYQGDRRSPHWFDAVKFMDHAGRDSSLWIARRLQATDTVPPRFEIITVDATGQLHVALHSQAEVRDDYRLGTVTALVAEDSRPEFPLSVVPLLWGSYLFVVLPLVTGLLGLALLRRPRSAREAV